MNQIRAIQALNEKELQNGTPPEASWHLDYRDTAFIYFGGLPYELSEGDVITIFSQFGEPVFLKLARDKETGKSKGFGWLKYEDQRSTDLAVDNLGGTTVGGRMLRVDHARYKHRDDEDPDEGHVGWTDMMRREGKPGGGGEGGERRGRNDDDSDDDDNDEPPWEMLPEEKELAKLLAEHDDDDPMKPFLADEKRKEIEEARRRRDKEERKRRRRHSRDRAGPTPLDPHSERDAGSRREKQRDRDRDDRTEKRRGR